MNGSTIRMNGSTSNMGFDVSKVKGTQYDSHFYGNCPRPYNLEDDLLESYAELIYNFGVSCERICELMKKNWYTPEAKKWASTVFRPAAGSVYLKISKRVEKFHTVVIDLVNKYYHAYGGEGTLRFTNGILNDGDPARAINNIKLYDKRNNKTGINPNLGNALRELAKRDSKFWDVSKYVGLSDKNNPVIGKDAATFKNTVKQYGVKCYKEAEKYISDFVYNTVIKKVDAEILKMQTAAKTAATKVK